MSHYLMLNEEDVERIGALAKCAPPIREESEREQMVIQLEGGNILTVGSDHSPAPMSMKTDADFFKVWSGNGNHDRVAALPAPPQPGVTHGSKVTGEPPLMLAISVREAIRDAVAAFGNGGVEISLASPATPEAVLTAIRRSAKGGQ